MKERKKTTPHLLCNIFLQMLGSLLAFFHLCFVSVVFSVASLTEMKFLRNFFPTINCTWVVDFSICIVHQLKYQEY